MIRDLIKICLYYLIILFPKKKTLVFGDRAGRRFADNSRYLFFYLCQNRKDYKCIWISSNYKIINYLRQKKFLCYHPFSLGGIYYCLTAKYHLYNFVENDVNKIITELSDSIHLWHGVLPKKIKEIKVKSSKSNQFLYRKVKKFFLYPNEKLSKNIFDRFPPNKYNLRITNLPRNIIFSNKEINQDMFRTDDEIKYRKILKERKKNIFGYFPTWRSDGLELFRDIEDLNNLEKINKSLEKTNSLMLIKKHMNSDIKDKNLLYNSEIENLIKYLEKLNNFVFVDYDFDLNSILDVCDILVSDYSGVIFDYLYLDRPIITYTPDYNEFEKNVGFMFDPVKNNFTYNAVNINELNELILKYSENKIEFIEKHKDRRNSVKSAIFSESSEMDQIINLIDLK